MPQSLPIAELTARVAGAADPAERAGLMARLLPLLSDPAVPTTAKVHAAAEVIRTGPDTLEAVRPVARALTRRLGPLRGLDRLRRLQNQLETSDALDALIDRREQRVKMDCPRCGVRLPRVAMVKHLWHEHGLTLDHGKVRPVAGDADEAKDDPAALDQTVSFQGTDGLRAWIAAADAPAEDTAPLRALAEEHRAGLCPGCFAEVPAPVPPLPAPLTLENGRLAGDGYVVAVGGADWFRTVAVRSPSHPILSGLDRRRAFGPRGAAALTAFPVLLGAVLAAFLVPPRVIPPFLVVCWLMVAAAVTYGVMWYTCKPLPHPDDQAVDTGWDVLARRLVERENTARFLTRLCLASLGRGDPVERAGLLHQIVERAAEAAPESDDYLQLLAAARVLQVEDGGRFGRDRVAGVAELAAAGFLGTLPADYAEHVVGCFLARNSEANDRARLRVLLLGAAFDAQLRPRDIIDLWTAAPHLRQAMAVEPVHRLGLLHGVWAMRNTRRWERVAPADTAFELARSAPLVSGRVLAEFPDLLLMHRPEGDFAGEIGPVLVCSRGVFVGGHLVADLEAAIEIEKLGRFGGGYELVFGRHRVKLTRRPPDDFPDLLRGWLKFRSTVLLPLIDGYLQPGQPDTTARLLTPFSRKCRRCGVVSAVAIGAIGRAVPSVG